MNRILKTVITALFITSYAISVFAQDKTRVITITGRVQDYVAHNELVGASIDLLSKDSTTIMSSTAELGNIGDKRLAQFSLDFKAVQSQYILKIGYSGYSDFFVDIDLETHKDQRIELPTIYLRKPCDLTLDEVEVVATKIKFYHKGDTIVYNADAFQLAEGSMLDNLVAQLPGAELKSNGQIYVNGRYVNELLLNGRDFYRGNNSVMLQNLPTYMIDKIKVYDKASELSIASGHDMGDNSFVMDVNLKKKYNIGFVGNVDVGYGTDERNLARLFAMRMSDHSRVSLVVNQNNVNDHTRPAQSSDWTPEKTPLGRLTTRMVGIDANVWGRDDKFNLSSTTQYQGFNNNIERDTHRENIFASGSTYDRITQQERVRNWTASTKNKLNLKLGSGVFDLLNIQQNLSFQRSTPESSSLSITTLKPFEETTDFINKNSFSSLQKNNIWTGNIDASYIKMIGSKPTKDMLQAMAMGSFGSSERNGFYNRSILSSDGNTTYQNRFINTPEHKYHYLLGARYYQFISNVEFRYMYSYEQDYLNANKEVYCLEKLDEWNNNDKEIGILPSEVEYMNTLDLRNSYQSRLLTRIHSGVWEARWRFYNDEKKEWRWNSKISMLHTNRDFSFRKSDESRLTRHWTLFDGESEVIFMTRDRKRSAQISYSMKHTLPDMLYLVDYVDDTNPLNVIYGNAGLKYSTSHRFNSRYDIKKGSTTISPSAYFSLTDDAIAMAIDYDRQTGRREYHPENVDGNWKTGAAFSITFPVDKNRKWFLTDNLKEDYTNSVDLVKTSEQQVFGKSVVRSSYLSDNIRLDYKAKSYSLAFKGQVAWNRATGGNALDVDINAFDFNYGFTAMARLPWKLDVNSDLTLYNRRGYEYAQMNSSDLVWNLRISRPFLKGRLVLVADAFDLCGQLKNTHFTVNAQGKTEVLNNTVHRYILLHAIVRLDKKPK